MAIRFINTGEKASSYYRASDGNTFSTKSAAEAHEASLNSSSSGSSSSSTQSVSTTGADNQTLDDGQGTQQRQQVSSEPKTVDPQLSDAEALEYLKTLPAAQKGILASLEHAKERGDTRLINTHQKQLQAEIETVKQRSIKVVDQRTNEVKVKRVKGVSDGKKYVYDKQKAAAEHYNAQRGFAYVNNSVSSILGDSDVAQTPEQKAQLVALATEIKQFGGRTFSAVDVRDVLQKAFPEMDKTEVWRLGTGIRQPVAVNPQTRKAYTTYGSGLTIELSGFQDGGGADYNIVSPEGVRLDNFDFSARQMLQYGISKEAVLAAGAKAEAADLNPVANNKYTTLVYSLQNDVDPEVFKNYTVFKNQENIQKDAAFDAFYAGEGDLAARFEEAKKSFEVDPGDTTKPSIQFNNFKGQFFQDNYTGPSGTTLEEFVNSGGTMLEGLPEGMVDLGGGLFANPVDLSKIGADRRNSFDDKGVMKSKYGQAARDSLNFAAYGIVNLAAPTADPTKQNEYTLPSWSFDSYTQKLNDIYQTPNNNITFGDGGLSYRYPDGTTTRWGANVENLDAFSVMAGATPTDGRMGLLFKVGQQFNSAEEYEAFKRQQDQAQQTPQVQAPTVSTPTADTDDLESTSTAGTTTDTASRPDYIGAQTDVSGTPTATGNVTTQQPAAQQPATQQPTTMPTYGTAPISGTFGTPLQTAGLSAVPTYSDQQTTPPAQQAGFAAQQLAQTTPSTDPGSVGVKTVQYTNQYGQSIPVTETNGQPITYVPPGYTKAAGAAKGGMMRSGYAEGGVANQSSEDTMLEAKYRIATMNGYNGPKTNASLNAFANASEGMKRKFNAIGTVMANKGGYIKRGFDEGGLSTPEELAKAQANLVGQTMQPMQAPLAQIQPQEQDFIPTTAGMVNTAAPMAEAATVGTVQQSQTPVLSAPATMQPAMAAPQVQAEVAQLQAAQGTVSPQAQMQAAQQQQVSMAGMEAAQGQAYMMNNPVQREIQQGELISGVADAQKAAQFNEQIQAATATPTAQATIQGQLEGLMQQFEGGETPAWAAGSMRAAMATLSARGLGASSMAGQAVIQATMEAALPIAQMDAQTQAQFEAQNLSNRQQRAMLAAQQRAQFLGQEFDQAFQARVANSARIGDIANMNFTAEQNIALENSRAANTMNLNNLSNRQAMVMAEAATLSQLDMANLNNRQQAAVQNAQNFMQMDMANLSNEQQTAMFKSQQNLQALFTDQAAENAAAQFNAASENQTNQFFASLTGQTAQFNAAQQNAMDQFNVNSVNALREFNSEIQQQRDLFNAQNGLVIAQSNAQWRQNIATINTAQQNQSNMDFAKTMNALTASNMDQIWQRERDLMSFSFAASESAADRAANIALAKLTADEQAKLQDSIGKGKLLAIGAEKLLDNWLG